MKKEKNNITEDNKDMIDCFKSINEYIKKRFKSNYNIDLKTHGVENLINEVYNQGFEDGLLKKLR